MTPLFPNMVYHIFNHANGFENVFCCDDNFRFFIRKYIKHIAPIAETYAYCLMPNHFHVIIRIRKREIIQELMLSENFSKVLNFGKVDEQTNDKIIELFLSKQFSNLFSSYTQAFNKIYKRKGSLFIKNFRRNMINSKEYFLNSIIYTHRNPVHHGFCQCFEEWDYSSYNKIINEENSWVETEKLLKVFGGKDNFIEMHKENLMKIDIDDFF